MTDNKPPLRVAIWCAVSSKPQAAEDKSSLADQEAAGRQFAEAIHGVVVRVYQVPGNTRDIIFWGEAEREMDAYRQLRQDAEAGVFDVLHAIDPDRIGRDPALANQVVSLVDKSGAEVYFASNPHVIGQRSAGQRYVFAIQSTRAQEDQLRRVEYHARGMRARAKNGLHSGIWPYGYEPIYDGSRVIGARLNADAAAVVRLITERFLAGDPYNQIVRVLNASPYRLSRSDRPWHRSTVTWIMHNDHYAGIVVYMDKVYPSDRFPALWDEATYAAVIRERARRKDAHGRRTNSPLNHVAYCARCGSTMQRGAHGSMGCARHIATGDCHPNYTKERTIREAVLQFLEGMSEDVLEQLIASQGDNRQAFNEELEALAGELDRVEDQRTRLALAFAAGKMDIDIYQVADQKLKQAGAYWHDRRREIEQRLASLPDVAQRRQALQALRARLSNLFTIPALEANTLLRDAGIRVYCENRQIQRIALECD